MCIACHKQHLDTQARFSPSTSIALHKRSSRRVMCVAFYTSSRVTHCHYRILSLFFQNPRKYVEIFSIAQQKYSHKKQCSIVQSFFCFCCIGVLRFTSFYICKNFSQQQKGSGVRLFFKLLKRYVDFYTSRRMGLQCT